MIAHRRNMIPGARYFHTAAPADRASALLIDRVADLRAVYRGVRLETRVSQKTLNPGYIYYDAALHDFPGDANGDHAYTAADGTVIANLILQTGTAAGNPDCNQDGQVNVQDLVCLNTHIATDATVQNFGYDNLDRLTNYTALTTNQSFNYDANGNIANDGSHSYGYDPRNRLVSVDGTTTYTLNGLGQRIKKQSSTAPTYGPGDANGDNAYTSADSSVILNQILQLATATGNPDCNQDGG